MAPEISVTNSVSSRKWYVVKISPSVSELWHQMMDWNVFLEDIMMSVK